MVTRAIERVLDPDATPARVIVLEGARAVGKTWLAHRLVENGRFQLYTSLADQVTFQQASADLPGWLRSLPPRTVIDEAQLLRDLPLCVKTLVDEPAAAGPRRQFLLTGSSSIGRTGLGGSDPLAGRAETWRLDPLTGLELAGHPEGPAALLAQLFGPRPTTQRQVAAPDGDIRETIMAGGFPDLALSPWATARRDRWVRDAVLRTLSPDVLPGERFDRAQAQRVIDACFRTPGAVLNVNSLAQRIGIVPRTVDRYLDVAQQRFLLHFLPNLATGPARPTRARSKVIPVDPAFAAESIRRANPRAFDQPEIFGALVEAYVAAQVLAAAAVSEVDHPVTVYYWRDAKTKLEVDLVLTDGAGAMVGIEVKSSTTLRPEYARSLRAFLAATQAHAGYVVYLGDDIVRLDDRVWGIPLQALGHPWAD
ncbi:MAG: DUF4143 domain-containing protein [Bifidobacteriaceae bacterium]|jgi:predicted AAA+ superfamily ATPase|nr:DUF4143 domain-containing protein [Bifidobacteriaceae bacterium]